MEYPGLLSGDIGDNGDMSAGAPGTRSPTDVGRKNSGLILLSVIINDGLLNDISIRYATITDIIIG